MKALVSAALSLLLSACDPVREGGRPAVISAENEIPILPVHPGDSWVYEVDLEIPAGVTSAGAAAVSTEHRRTRTYLGKLAAAEGLPETDCFEVTTPGFSAEREFVEILDDRILIRGSLIMRPETTKPLWLDRPVPFVAVGMQPGESIPVVEAADGGLIRQSSVVAREDVAVPAGTFHCIQLLTDGIDGDLELRRNLWFSPGHGIIREEKIRRRHGRTIFSETQQLVEIRKVPQTGK